MHRLGLTLIARPDFLQYPAYYEPIWPTPLDQFSVCKMCVVWVGEVKQKEKALRHFKVQAIENVMIKFQNISVKFN